MSAVGWQSNSSRERNMCFHTTVAPSVSCILPCDVRHVAHLACRAIRCDKYDTHHHNNTTTKLNTENHNYANLLVMIRRCIIFVGSGGGLCRMLQTVDGIR